MHEQTGCSVCPYRDLDDDRSVRNAVGRLLRSVGFRVAPFATRRTSCRARSTMRPPASLSISDAGDEWS